MRFWGSDEDDEAARARALAEAEEEKRQYRERMARFETETGYRNLAREPFIPPMFKCLRCGVPVFDRNVHDEWHSSMGQEWLP